MKDKLHLCFLNHFEDRLFPCNITRDTNGKKQVQLAKGWTDTMKGYEDFDNSNSNSVALRTGTGITVVDVDTKDLSVLELNMQELVKKWLNDKATFIVETTNGYHFYFDSNDASYSNAVRVSNYVDIRGDGGCVFCYTEDTNSFYKVLCEQEPLPLTQELVNYISLKEQEAKSVEFSFDSSNKKIALEAHKYNKLMAKGFDSNDTDMVLKSTGFVTSDFSNIDGLYSRIHKLAFILAMNSACKNEKVLKFIEHIITKYSGFDITSEESAKRLSHHDLL